MSNSEQYADIQAPVQGQVYGKAHTLTAARYEVPPDWVNEVVTFTSTLSDCRVLFGGPGVAVRAAANTYSTTTGETLTPSHGRGTLICAGATRPFYVKPVWTHFAIVSDGTLGDWTAEVASGEIERGEQPPQSLDRCQILYLDSAKRDLMKIHTGVLVSRWASAEGYEFVAPAAKPDWLEIASVGGGMIQPAVSFVSASSERLTCTDAELAALFGGVKPFSLYLSFRRHAAAAAHTLFSVGTDGSNNGRFDIQIDASDDLILTRVDTAGNSVSSTLTASLTAAAYSMLFVFDGTTLSYYQDRVATPLTTNSFGGDIGTPTKVTLGARGYNTSTYDRFADMQLQIVWAANKALSPGEIADVFNPWTKRRTAK